MLVKKETSEVLEKYNYQGPITQDAVHEWLRRKYDCYVHVFPDLYPDGINWIVQVLFYNPKDLNCLDAKSSGQFGDNHEFPTYEDALEFGIQLALKRI